MWATRDSSIRFLAQEKQETSGIVDEVAASIRMKVRTMPSCANRLRTDSPKQIANAAAPSIERAAARRQADPVRQWRLGHRRQRLGARLRVPPAGYRPVPAISLSWNPPISPPSPTMSARKLIFLRQLIAHARPEDVAIGISTSGGSKNIIVALEEARKRGLLTVALLGYDGGEILRRGLADWPSWCAPTTSREFRKCRPRSTT